MTKVNQRAERRKDACMITSVLLDLDGTLVDSNDAHAMAWMEALRAYSISVTFPQVREKIGMGADQLLPALGIFPENAHAHEIEAKRGDIFRRRYLPGIRPFPGAKELVEHLMRQGFKLIVATSSNQRDLTDLLGQTGLDDLLKSSTSARDAESSKPEPDIIQAALKKVHAAPTEALMIGDTPYDIYSARRAGVDTIAFTCGGSSAQDLRDAIAIYEGPQELLKAFRKSPLRARAA
jgi:HAD superfamily hydrolase (TIGR01509 family)